MKSIKIYTATVITCAKYAKDVLNNDLSGLAGGGCGGGCGCGGSNSLITIDDLVETFGEMEGYTIEVVNHDTEADKYYKGLDQAFENMGYQVHLDDSSVEYVKSVSPIITVDDEIISMGRLPDDFEIIEAIETNTKLAVTASAGF